MSFEIIPNYFGNRAVNTHASCSRPFRRHRPGFNIFEIQNTIGQWTKQVKYFSNSVVGKLAIYTAAETTGGLVGAYAAGKMGGALALPVGRLLGSKANLLLSGGLALTASKVDVLQKSLLLGLSLWAIFSKIDFSEEGGKIGWMAGKFLGEIAGTIVGGYIGLKMAEAEPIFLGGEDPANSYSVSMARFIAAGVGYDVFLGCKPPIPLLDLPRTCIRALVQTAAYNYPHVKPFVENCIRERKFSKEIFLPLLADMIANVASGSHSSALVKKSSESIVSSIPFLHSLLKSQMNALTQFGIGAGLKKIDENSDEIASFILGSVHEFILLIQRSDQVQKAVSNPKALQKALHERIGKGLTLKQEIFNKGIHSLVQDGGIDKALEPMSQKILELEEQLFGFSILKKKGAVYLKDAAAVYLRYYIVFACLNIEKFSKAISLSEEQQMSRDLNDFLFHSYFRPALPPNISKNVHRISDFALESLFKIKKGASLLFHASEETTVRRGTLVIDVEDQFKCEIKEQAPEEFIFM